MQIIETAVQTANRTRWWEKGRVSLDDWLDCYFRRDAASDPVGTVKIPVESILSPLMKASHWTRNEICLFAMVSCLCSCGK